MALYKSIKLYYKSIFILLLFIGIAYVLINYPKVLNNPQIRKTYINKLKNVEDSLFFFENEDFAIIKNKKELFKKQEKNSNTYKYEDNIKPNGILISTYYGKGTDTFQSIEYYTKKEKVTRGFIRPKQHINYWGETWYDWDYVEETFTVPVTHHKTTNINYDYSYSFSTFDISKEYGIFKKEKDVTNKLFKDYCNGIRFPENWIFTPNLYWGKKDTIKAISYKTRTKSGINVIRSFIFANKKAYMLEVCANYDLIKRANTLLSYINIDSPKKLRQDIQKEWYQLIISLIAPVSLFMYIILFLMKKEQKNKIAKRLLYYTASMTLIVTFLIITEWWLVYIEYLVYDSFFKKITSILSISLLLINLPTLLFLRFKSYNEFSYDFVLPQCIKKYLSKRKVAEEEKKMFVAIIAYPLLILGTLPFGILILLYVLPMCLIYFVINEIKHLNIWVYGNTNAVKEITNNRFKDYYYILDISPKATNKEIQEKYFNTLSEYYKFNKINNNQQFFDLQEAYKVLASKDFLRAIYDEEYLKYHKTRNSEYVISDQQLLFYINNIRQEIYNSTKMNNKKKNNNVLLALILFLIMTLSIYLIHISLGNEKNHQKHSFYKDPDLEQVNKELKRELGLINNYGY